MTGPASGLTMVGMDTTVHEIAEGVYRLSTFVPDIEPFGLTFNQFLLTGDEPLLFHCGHRQMFPSVSAALARVMPVERLRWISFGHVEADECGSMNDWLAAAPDAQVAHGELACAVSLNDLADRPPRALAEGEVLDIGGHRIRHIPTPHVPHNWEAQLMFDETTATLLCGDLFTQGGPQPALVHDADLITPAAALEDAFAYSSLGANTVPTIRGLAELAPRTLALMHGPSAAGDGGAALRDLAASYADRIAHAGSRAA